VILPGVPLHKTILLVHINKNNSDKIVQGVNRHRRINGIGTPGHKTDNNAHNKI